MNWESRLIASEPFAPEPFAALGNAFPEGAVPEAAYQGWCKDYAAIADVDVRRIAYESDGLKITGLAAFPKNLAQGAHPLTLYNRGGSREFGRLTVRAALYNLVPLARMGHIALASNYRGSAGGEGVDTFGGADVRDVLGLLAIGQEHPGWDGRSRYMIGHSRGGMMTYLAIKAGAPLNAAIAIAALADLEQSARERPGMEDFFRRIIPKDSPEARAERSAIRWPEALSVPLLLLHGDADERVSVSQSQALAQALTRIGMPHRLVLYPRGNHALTRHWSEAQREMGEWIAAHAAR
jgi:dipeptidyl aminopeptidase/acylaminoacyl peptidase